jgi:pimeloyl-ACP methyl ester carboxylesterase
LGVEQINLFGVSFGSHLALAVLRRHPDAIRCAVLASVEGPDHTDKLPIAMQQGLIELDNRFTGTDSFHGAGIPDLLADALAVLDRQPRAVQVDEAGRTVVVGPEDLRICVSEALGYAEPMGMLPGRLAAMADGDFRWLAEWAAHWRTRAFEELSFWTMDISSGCSPARADLIDRQRSQTLLQDAVNVPIPDLRATCGLRVLEEDFRQPVVCDVPVLLLSGTLDFRTPPDNAGEVATTLPRSSGIVVDGGTHGRGMFTPEICDATTEFLRSGQPPTPGEVLKHFQFADRSTVEPVR